MKQQTWYKLTSSWTWLTRHRTDAMQHGKTVIIRETAKGVLGSVSVSLIAVNGSVWKDEKTAKYRIS